MSKKNRLKKKKTRYKRRKNRVNTKALAKNKGRMRLLVNKSNCYTYAYLIKLNGDVIAQADDKDIQEGTKTEKAKQVGKRIAKIAKENDIQKVFFDRNGYKYHGRIKAVAEGARENGLEF